MNSNEMKPLQPLSDGMILVVGAKASNFGEEIRNHPRVIMWDSQNQSWKDKDFPANTRAVFITRFIGHTAFDKIISEARRRQITIFNPDGTGMITRQVKELLGMNTQVGNPKFQSGKLKALIPFIDFSKNNVANGRALLIKAEELGITSTEQSLTQLVSVQRKRQNRTAVPRSIQSKIDVSVEILDNMVRELQDMRDFLVATVEENKSLKLKVERFKKALEE